MNDQLKSQIDILQKSISLSEGHYDKLVMLDALRSAWLLAGDNANAEIVACDFNEQATIFLREQGATLEQKEDVLQKMFDAYVTLAPNDFHSFLMALEWERDPSERFYQPRLSILRPITDDMSDMIVKDKYDMMMLSMPPGTGKSTLGLFYLMWVIGREPDKCNLEIGRAHV